MNQTRITSFLLWGFQNIQIENNLLFVFFLIIYILTLVENIFLIILVTKTPTLRSPMYVFLSQLSLSDILLTTNITPNLLQLLINGGTKICIRCCITQFYFHCVSASLECLLLTAMSYDRYLAICNPLRYSSIMDSRLCSLMIFLCWSSALTLSLIIYLSMYSLVFCGPSIIDNYFCDLEPILSLSCSDTRVAELTDFILGIPFTLCPLLFIVFTYISIFFSILRISTIKGRHKAFSTCSAHLSTVCLYYGCIIIVYLMPVKGHLINFNKIISLVYTVGTPLLNPVIYSLRNTQIRKSLLK